MTCTPDVFAWVCDWSSFIPDLIVGVVTGLVVGLALWGAQSLRARSERSAHYRRSWSAIRTRLPAFVTPDIEVGDFAGNLRAYPTMFEPILEVLEDEPISEWETALRHETDFGMAKDLQERARLLPAQIDFWWRCVQGEMDRHSVVVDIWTTPFLESFVIELAPAQLENTPARERAAIVFAQYLRDNEGFASAHAALREALSRTHESYHRLRNAIIPFAGS